MRDLKQLYFTYPGLEGVYSEPVNRVSPGWPLANEIPGLKAACFPGEPAGAGVPRKGQQ
jgi:hypothetical protein